MRPAIWSTAVFLDRYGSHEGYSGDVRLLILPRRMHALKIAKLSFFEWARYALRPPKTWVVASLPKHFITSSMWQTLDILQFHFESFWANYRGAGVFGVRSELRRVVLSSHSRSLDNGILMWNYSGWVLLLKLSILPNLYTSAFLIRTNGCEVEHGKGG